MAISPMRTRRWTRLEYERLVNAGIFRPGERLEPGASITPLVRPAAPIEVAALLPRATYSR